MELLSEYLNIGLLSIKLLSRDHSEQINNIVHLYVDKLKSVDINGMSDYKINQKIPKVNYIKLGYFYETNTYFQLVDLAVAFYKKSINTEDNVEYCNLKIAQILLKKSKITGAMNFFKQAVVHNTSYIGLINLSILREYKSSDCTEPEKQELNRLAFDGYNELRLDNINQATKYVAYMMRYSVGCSKNVVLSKALLRHCDDYYNLCLMLLEDREFSAFMYYQELCSVEEQQLLSSIFYTLYKQDIIATELAVDYCKSIKNIIPQYDYDFKNMILEQKQIIEVDTPDDIHFKLFRISDFTKKSYKVYDNAGCRHMYEFLLKKVKNAIIKELYDMNGVGYKLASARFHAV
jgi:hypothetical protein